METPLKLHLPQATTALSIYFLALNLFGFKGGIQVYSAFLLQALQQAYPRFQYQVFLKYDRAASPHLRFAEGTQFHYFGCWPRWLQTLLLAARNTFGGIWQRPVVVIATHINYSVACDWLKQLIGIHYWVVVHGLEVRDIQKPILRGASYHADRIIAVSEYTRDRLLQSQEFLPEKFLVLSNTFDARQFRIGPKPKYLLQRYGLNQKQPVILTVTRSSKSAYYKGYDQVLQTLIRIRQQIPHIHYVLVGQGDDTPRIQSQIAKLNLQDCVTLAGFISDVELGDHYNLCDVFTLPSQGEGFGIVFLEALACGKPVLAGNQDGSIDPLMRGNLGCLVDPTAIK